MQSQLFILIFHAMHQREEEKRPLPPTTVTLQNPRQNSAASKPPWGWSWDSTHLRKVQPKPPSPQKRLDFSFSSLEDFQTPE